MILRYLYALLAMGRPLFLIGTVPLYLLGVVLAWHESESLNWPELVCGFALVWMVKLMTHYNNEYYDLETDRATRTITRISGGSRILVKGLVPHDTALIAAIACLLTAAILTFSIIFSFDVGYLFLALVIPAFFVGWFYSGPPVKLVSRGLGEVAIIIVACLLLPLTAYYLQTSMIAHELIVLGIPLGLLTFALILTVELPDIAADESTGKLTLAVRLGLKKAMTLQFISLCAGFVCFSIAVIYVLELPVWAAFLSGLPIAGMLLFAAGNSGNIHLAAIEKTGICMALIIGYTSILFNCLLFLK